MFRAQVLPMASEVLPMGNSTLTSIAVEGTTAAYVVCSCASAHREKGCQIGCVFLKNAGIYVFGFDPTRTY